jgi:hypothetical protein
MIMSTINTAQTRTLDQQLHEFRQRRFLATPLAGAIIWFILIFTGLFLPPKAQVLAVFVGTGSIVYLALFLSRLTGERLKFQGNKQRNFFDTLFLSNVAMCFLVYAIALPYFVQNYKALPFAVAVLTGLMWLPMSVMIQHWIGLFHAVVRTALCTLAWIFYPEHSFVLQALIVVLIYAITIVVLEMRWRKMQARVATLERSDSLPTSFSYPT